MSGRRLQERRCGNRIADRGRADRHAIHCPGAQGHHQLEKVADTNGRHGAVQWNRPGPVAQKRWGYLRRGTLVARSCPLGILEIDVDQLRPRQQRQRRGEVVPQ